MKIDLLNGAGNQGRSDSIPSSRLRRRRSRESRRLYVESLEKRELLAADLSPMIDINTTSDSGSSPDSTRQLFAQVGSSLYFVASTPTTGEELWKTDGTTQGTAMVKDIADGPTNSEPLLLTNVNGTLFFTTDLSLTGGRRSELWTSDGTEGGTKLVRSFVSGAEYKQLNGFVDVGGTLFFRATQYSANDELWKSDGTLSGTTLVKSFPSGAFQSYRYSDLTNVNGTLYFAANGNTQGAELWRSDGTESGTVMLKDIQPGSGSSSPSTFFAMGSSLFFWADDGSNGRELWKSDGTTDGTAMVKNIAPGSNRTYIGEFEEMNGTLYFSGATPAEGHELWSTDGTADGTRVVTDLNAGLPTHLTNVNGKLYFAARTTSTSTGIFSFTPGTSSTSLVKDFFPGPQDTQPSFLTNVGGILYLIAEDGVNGKELWKSDGTSSGTQIVRVLTPGTSTETARYLTNFNGTLVFRASDGVIGDEIWKSDGTVQGTVPIKDIAFGTGDAETFFSMDYGTFAPLGGSVVFAANDGVNGSELWKSDGTGQGTVLVKDIYPVPPPPLPNRYDETNGSKPIRFTELNGSLYFIATDSRFTYHLFKTDGTLAGTVRVESTNPNEEVLPASNLVNLDGTLYFGGYDTQPTLWRTDGTPSGTAKVTSLVLNIGRSLTIENLTAAGGRLFFQLEDRAVSPYALWTSDGTAAGTRKIRGADNLPITAVGKMHDVNGTLFFAGYDSTTDWALWKSDGTDAGTVRVKDINSNGPDFDLWNFEDFTVAGGKLFFMANDGTHGREVWVSDGTAAGTRMVADINPGPTNSYPPKLVAVGDSVYFSAFDGVNSKLWVTDGTTTRPVFAGPQPFEFASTQKARNVNGLLYFNAYDPIHGFELWRTDGTPGGTSLVADIAENRRGSSAVPLGSLGNKLFVAATTDSYGREFYVFDAPSTPSSIQFSNSSIAENRGSGAIVGTLSSIDADSSGPFTYSLVAGTGSDDNASFTIVGNELRTTATFDFEAKSSYTIRVRSTDPTNLSLEQSLRIQITNVADAAVLDRRVFYNRSNSLVFGDGSGNPSNAIDFSKQALLPGQTATLANYTNYARGLNGLIVDVAGLGAAVSSADFQFATWDGFSPGGFAAVTTKPTIGFLAGAGLNGSTRVKIEFPDRAIRDTWLRVTFIAGVSSELSANEVFYFGSAIGDVGVGNVGSPIVVRNNASDTAAIRQNQSPHQNSVGIGNIFDINKDGRVNSADTAAARQNQTPTGAIALFTAPASMQSPPHQLNFDSVYADLSWLDESPVGHAKNRQRLRSV